MALVKFSKFKKERATIKEARNKEMKSKKFNQLFSETLKELGLNSVADLSEEQMNSFLSALKTKKINEGRAEEIEAHTMAAGEPQPAGMAGEINQKHGFDSPQDPNTAEDAKAEDLKADENDTIEVEVVDDNAEVTENAETVNEAKFKKGQYIKAKRNSDDFDGDVYDKTNDVDGSEILKNSSFEIYKISKDEVILWSDADEVEYSIDPDDLKNFVKESVVNEAEIKSDKEFEDYATDVLKKSHPDDYDEAIAKKVIDGLKDKYKDDYGAMVGALTSGFGG